MNDEHGAPPAARALAPITVAEPEPPVMIFNYEVMTINDPKVAKLTKQMLRLSTFLFAIAVAQFVVEIVANGISVASGVLNLIVALALPLCGVIGVRDRNVICLQYFCCMSYVCALVTGVSLITIIVLVSRGQRGFFASLVLYAILLVVYYRGGILSTALQNEPYFTKERLNPGQRSANLGVHTVDFRPQPVAEVELAPVQPVYAVAYAVPAPYSGASASSPFGHFGGSTGRPGTSLDAGESLRTSDGGGEGAAGYGGSIPRAKFVGAV
jgi:hypothetical protein